MSVLYPLNIESTIPAFYKEQGQFIVPFSLNRATSQEEVQQIYAVIKTIQSNTYIINDLFGEIDQGFQVVSFYFSLIVPPAIKTPRSFSSIVPYSITIHAILL